MTNEQDHKKNRRLRLDLGIQQQHVAAEIGVSPSRLSAYERHGYPLPVAAKVKLDEYLKGGIGK